MKQASLVSRTNRVFKIYEDVASSSNIQINELDNDFVDSSISFLLRAYITLQKRAFMGCVIGALRSEGFAVDDFRTDLMDRQVVINRDGKTSVRLYCPIDHLKINERSELPDNSGLEFYHRVVYDYEDLSYGDQRFVNHAHQNITDLIDMAKTVKRRGSSLEQLWPLSPREIEVLGYLADGRTGQEIGEKLGISIKTVERHKENLKRKTGLTTLAGLIKFAINKGLTSI